tara:strand:- start:1583 stop:2017 length:435 start_codon:yes stop_codon:yes gene_type:complete
MGSNLMYNSLFLYDWQKIYEKSRGDASSIFVIFKMIVNNEVPRNKFDKTYKFSNLRFIGGSFLVHPDVLLYNSYKYSHVEVAQYLALASLRPLSDYLTTGKTSLERNLLELDISFFEDNRLLNIQEDKIIFEYEEVPQEKTQWH